MDGNVTFLRDEAVGPRGECDECLTVMTGIKSDVKGVLVLHRGSVDVTLHAVFAARDNDAMVSADSGDCLQGCDVTAMRPCKRDSHASQQGH